jgi:hypothetical protein
MSVIVRDDGFHADDYTGTTAIDIASDTSLRTCPTCRALIWCAWLSRPSPTDAVYAGAAPAGGRLHRSPARQGPCDCRPICDGAARRL